MTKDEEIEELEKFIKFLEASGNTYLGPWLRHALPNIENAIRADLCPSLYTMSWTQWKAHLDHIQKDSSDYHRISKEMADENAALIIAKAEQKDKDADAVIDEARTALAGAIYRLDHR